MKKKTSIMFPHLLAGSVILTCMILAYPSWPLSFHTLLMALAGYIAGRMDQKYYN